MSTVLTKDKLERIRTKLLKRGLIAVDGSGDPDIEAAIGRLYNDLREQQNSGPSWQLGEPRSAVSRTKGG